MIGKYKTNRGELAYVVAVEPDRLLDVRSVQRGPYRIEWHIEEFPSLSGVPNELSR